MGIKEYIRERFFPHIWCPGCGHGIVLNCLLHAADKLELNKKNIALVSGIGCSSRISGYVDFHTLHTLHGRALAFATGLKLHKPEMNVLVTMGDGDALAIGGNHFIHAARRNIDMTALVLNNRIYGMTGGQYSPLSGVGILAATAPYGNIDPCFDTIRLAEAAGATFIARTTTYHVQETVSVMCEAIRHKGFSMVEILSQCPTNFGRKNAGGSPVEMMKFYKENTTPIGSQAKEHNPHLIERGVFLREIRPEYCAAYDDVMKRAQARD